MRGRLAALTIAMAVALALPAQAGAHVTPGSVDFGTTGASRQVSIDVSNDSVTDTWTMGQPYFDDGSAYEVVSSTCSLLLPYWPLQDCTVVVQFDAGSLAPGTYGDTLEIPHCVQADCTSEQVTMTGVVPDADVTPPSPPGAPVVADLEPTSVTLTWAASTDDTGVAGYTVWELDGDAATPVGTTTTNGYAVTGLLPGSTHTYAVTATDAAGNVSGQSDALTVTTPTPPPVPQGLTAAPTITSVALSWSAAGATDSTVAFVVQRQVGSGWATLGTVPVGSPPTLTSTGLAPATTYNFRVVAQDGSGLQSSPATVSGTTLPDTVVPVGPTVIASAVTSAGLHLSWSGASDNVAVAGYRIAAFEDNAWVTITTLPAGTTVAAITGLQPGQPYTIGVFAFDAAGNLSAPGKVSIHTLAGPAFTSLPVASFVPGTTATATAVPTRVSWVVNGPTACTTQVQRVQAGIAAAPLALSQPTARIYSWTADYGIAHQLRVQVSDCAQTATPWAATDVFTPAQLASSAIAFGPHWAAVKSSQYLGGGERQSVTSGASVTAKLTHVHDVAIVGACGSKRGSARIYLDGKLSATVSEHCSSGPRRVVYAHRFDTAGNHTVKVVLSSSHRFGVDAFVTM